MSEAVTLTYFDGRGRGEIIRIALNFANIPVSPLKLNKIEDFVWGKT